MSSLPFGTTTDTHRALFEIALTRVRAYHDDEDNRIAEEPITLGAVLDDALVCIGEIEAARERDDREAVRSAFVRLGALAAQALEHLDNEGTL